MPPLDYGDHLTPAVLLSMNTGLRLGELVSLRWANIDFQGALLTVEGNTAKSEQTRHVPLNTEAVDVLTRWRKQQTDTERVFPIARFKTAWTAILERAHISKFRWHDLRHHFASRLVQAGVPLNTVRELLGHGSLAMTLRYAHLAPDQKINAVAKLVRS
jgi:integrase